MSSFSPGGGKGPSNADLAVVGAITFLTIFVFGPVARHEFVDLDYLFYVGNPHVQQGLTIESIRWAFTSVVGSNWHPITMIAHMTVHQFFGASTAANHLANVFLHWANALLVFALLRRMTGATWPSGLVALLFSLHPLRVESVVWTAELKDVLSTFWALLALLAYVRFGTRRSAANYGLVAALYALALMSKASTVALPFLMLTLDWWPLGRFRPGSKLSAAALLLEKAPFVALAAGMSAITLFTFHDTTLKSTASLSLTYRAVMSLQAYLSYLVQTALPLRLAPHYPYVPLEHPLVYAVVPLIVLGSVTALAVWLRKQRPYLLAGWLWFLLAIAPVSGILPIGSHYRADRYTYLAHIGLFLALVWSAADLAHFRTRLRRPFQALAAAAVFAAAGLSYVNVGYWRDNLTLFSHAVRIAPTSSLMHSGLATAYIERKQFDLAEKELRTALDLDPDELRDEKRLAAILLLTDRAKESVPIYAAIAEAEPGTAENFLTLAIALEKSGDLESARRAAQQAQKLDPANPAVVEMVKRLLP